MRYDVTHVSGSHSPRFRCEFHSRAGDERRADCQQGDVGHDSAGSHLLFGESRTVFCRLCSGKFDYACGRWEFFAKRATAGTLCGRFLAGDFRADCELRVAIRHDIWSVHRLGAQSKLQSCVKYRVGGRHSARLSQGVRAAIGNCGGIWRIAQHGFPGGVLDFTITTWRKTAGLPRFNPSMPEAC